VSETQLDLESAARVLEDSADYRVLRRLPVRDRFADGPIDADQLASAVVLDTETTGIDTERDQVIELALVRFRYVAATGALVDIENVYSALEDPGTPIPPGATAIHGITDAMVRGQCVDDARVTELLRDAAWVVAHNAGFDRRFVERRWPVFESCRWVCSYAEVPWAEEGYPGAKLEYLVTQAGFFFDAHRSEMDCRALLEVLRQPLPRLGRTVWQQLLASGGQVTHRLWALGSPFESKDLLKARGYRWHAGRRCWHTQLPVGEQAGELTWLRENIYGGRSREIEIEDCDATQRYSARPGRVRRVAL